MTLGSTMHHEGEFRRKAAGMSAESTPGVLDPEMDLPCACLAIAGSAPLPMAILSGAGHIIDYANPAFCCLVAKREEELRGTPLVELVTEKDECLGIIDRVYYSGEFEIHTEEEQKEPSPLYRSFAVWPVLAADRRPQGVMLQITETAPFHEQSTVMNQALMLAAVRQHELMEVANRLNAQLQVEIVERKRTEEASERANSANKAKDQFIAVLSHELRTPLTPALATVSAMECQHGLSPAAKTDMQVIRRSLEMEARLIDDLLDITKIANGKVDLHPETVNTHTCLRAAMEICQPQIEARHLEISWNLQGAHHHVWGDPTRLRQVFWNLFGNAVKFTPENGRISVRTANFNGRLRIEITDTGIGIEPEMLPRIFKMFEQGDEGDEGKKRTFGGLGLGLSIVKAMVEMHQGSLTVFSEGKGKGATFTVELPTVPAVSESSNLSGGSAPQEDHPQKILLVDDDADTLQTMSRLLRRRGYDIEPATSVETALELATREPFDLVVSDIGLPDGSGLDIMRRVKELYGLHGIALSGYGTEEDLQQSWDAGFDQHLTKPVNFEDLHKAIRRIATEAA